MKNLTRIIFVGGFLSLAGGIYGYLNEEAFLRRAVKAVAKIEHVKDEPISIKTEGRLNGPQGYVDHVCRYTVIFDANDSQSSVTAPLINIGKPCLRTGDAIAIIYDSRSPSTMVRSQGDEAVIHPGLYGIIAGLIILFLNYFDLKKALGKSEQK